MDNNNMNKKPNFILLMTDQQRADLRRSRGFELDTMPFLDEWAKGGVDFERAYTPNPICLAARVSMFTGRTPETHRARTNHNAMDATYTEDLLDVLKSNGYVTALCGKNHTHHKPADFDFARTNGHLGFESEFNRTPEEEEFAQFMRSTDHMEVHHPSPYGIEVQFPYRNVRDALEFIDGLEGEQPFFLWLSMAEPHNPSQVPEPYFDMFPPDSLPPITGPEALAGKSERFGWLRSIWEEIMKDDIDRRIARTRSNYYGMLRLIDDQFRRLVDGVNERGLTGNTYIIYLADHGDLVGEYGLLRKGADLAEPLVNIPMIWRGPGISPRVSLECVNLIDILPTVCDIIGCAVPDGVQGKSIKPLLENRDIPEGEFDAAYSESGYGGMFWDGEDLLTPEAEGASNAARTRFDCLNTWTQCGEVRMARQGDYKVIVDSRGDGYLYDLAHDRLELNNLWNDRNYTEIKCSMLNLLVKQMLLHTDVLPYPHHRYRVKKHPLGYTEQKFISRDNGVEALRSYHGHNNGEKK